MRLPTEVLERQAGCYIARDERKDARRIMVLHCDIVSLQILFCHRDFLPVTLELLEASITSISTAAV